MNWNVVLITDGIKRMVNRLCAGRWYFFALFALFAVNLVSHQPRKHHAEGEPHRSRQVRGRHPDSQ